MSKDNQEIKLIDENGRRIDGRAIDEVRPIRIEVGVLKNANGSAVVEIGKTKVLAAVYGPRDPGTRNILLPDRATIRCRYHMAPFSTHERKSPAPSRREIELSKVIREAIEPSIISEAYPRTAIDIFIEILNADGGTRTAGVTAASLALADAGIPLRDLVAGIAVGKIQDTLVLDINEAEDMYGQADMPIAAMPNIGAITLIQLNGVLTESEFLKAIDLGWKGIRIVYEAQKEALKRKYIELKHSEVI